MILHAEHRFLLVGKTLHGLVIQVNVGHFHAAGIQRRGIQREVMILRGDFNRTGSQVLHRMIAAMMPELQPVCLAAAGQPEEIGRASCRERV